VAGAFAALPVLTSCSAPLDERDCERLLDHYTELLVLEENPGATPVQVAQKMDEARALSRKDPRFELSQCGRKVSRSSYTCAMAAPTVDAVERCMMF
jgi:hypothetical protein